MATVCAVLSVNVVPLIAVTTGMPVMPGPVTIIPTAMPVALVTLNEVLAVEAADAVVEAEA